MPMTKRIGASDKTLNALESEFLSLKSKMSRDPFSDVLEVISARSVSSGGLIAGGAWSIRFPASDRINFWGIVRGNCWCLVQGNFTPLRLGAGDFLLRKSPKDAVLASDLKVVPVELQSVTVTATNGISHHGLGDEFMMMGGKVDFDITRGAALVGGLPDTIHVPRTSPHAPALQVLLGQLVRECSDQLPGAGVASTQLAHLMFIQVLRAHMDSGAEHDPGWMRLLSNQRLAPAVRLMHEKPECARTLEELSRACRMSRASFAAHFKASAGIAPLAYLTQWRMRLAERALREEDTPVSSLGYRLGYGSESAFSNAFKRAVGEAPSRYRARVRAYQAT